MKTLPRLITLVAASSVVVLGATAYTPAIAFDYGYGAAPYSDPGYREHGWVGYGFNGYDRPGLEVRSGAVAICPPDYHLGRSGSLCWPD